MNKLLLLLTILSLTACGGGQIRPTLSSESKVDKKLQIDKALQKYVNGFISVGKKYDREIIIDSLILHFVDDLGKNKKTGNKTIGMCHYGDIPRISIAKNAFDNFDKWEREALLFHELGHCILGRGHIMEQFADGTPKSIMYPILIKSDIYESRYNHYMRELMR